MAVRVNSFYTALGTLPAQKDDVTREVRFWVVRMRMEKIAGRAPSAICGGSVVRLQFRDGRRLHRAERCELERRREAALPLTGRPVDVGAHRVRLYDAGEGSPTVVLLHGAGDCAASWLLVLVDATPEAAAEDPGVRMGFTMLASPPAWRLLSPFGMTRLLLRAGALVAEQARLREVVSIEEYQRWEADVCRTFASSAGSELQVVVPVTRAAQQARAGMVDPQFRDLPLGVLASHAFGDRWIEWQRGGVLLLL